MRLMSRIATVLAGIFLVASPLSAQTSFSIAAGAAVPVGDLADGANTGYNATLGIGIKPPLAPLGLRIEGAFNSFSGKGNNSDPRILAGLANLTISGAAMPMGYLIAGVGIYNLRQDLPAPFDDVSETDFGFNVGAGLSFPLTGFSTFLEARFHYVASDPNALTFIPITFGIKF